MWYSVRVQIGCPHCSKQYDLDPRLLPPTGASVQCTSCSFVFTALPSGEAVIPSQSARGEVSRTSNSSSTRIFGNPYLQQQQQQAERGATPQATRAIGKAGGPEDATTPSHGVQGPRSGQEAHTRTPARGSATVSAPAAGVGKTQVFGAPAAVRPPAASPSTTQVFGAVSVPQASAPGPTTTQVFGAVTPAGTPALPPAPSGSTTQVFGAGALPPTKPPAAVGTSTQVFGAISLPETKPPSPATTQVFGAGSIPSAAPRSSGSTTQVFGAGAIRGAEKTSERTGAAVGSGSGPLSLPPDAPVSPPSPTPVPLPPHGSASRPVTGSLSAPISLPPEPLPEREGGAGASRRLAAFEQPSDLFDRIDRQGTGARPEDSGAGRERLLVVVAAVVVLGLTIWLTYPMWRARGAGLPAEALRAKDEAVALLRRDDEASRELAFGRLRPLVAQFPKYTEAQAELGVALALKLDDVKVELALLGAQESRLRQHIAHLTTAQAPGDWESRVNAAKAELEHLSTQRQPLEASVEELTKELKASQLFIRTAPETEPAADVVARLKAQAVQAGVAGNTDAVGLAERLRQVETPAHWSAIALAEYGLNATPPPTSLVEYSRGLQALRERDKAIIRAYVLGARLALRQEDPATARTLLDTVEALNPHHTLARKLRAAATPAAAAP